MPMKNDNTFSREERREAVALKQEIKRRKMKKKELINQNKNKPTGAKKKQRGRKKMMTGKSKEDRAKATPDMGVGCFVEGGESKLSNKPLILFPEDISKDFEHICVRTDHDQLEKSRLSAETLKEENEEQFHTLFKMIGMNVHKWSKEELHAMDTKTKIWQNWCDDVALYMVYRQVATGQAIGVAPESWFKDVPDEHYDPFSGKDMTLDEEEEFLQDAYNDDCVYEGGEFLNAPEGGIENKEKKKKLQKKVQKKIQKKNPGKLLDNGWQIKENPGPPWDLEKKIQEEEEKCPECKKPLEGEDKCGEGCKVYDAGWKETHGEEE